MSGRRPEVLRVDPLRPSSQAVAVAAGLLRRGELVVLPTDTVYGVAADPNVAQAVERIYRAKGRDPGKPLPLLVADIQDVARRGAVLGQRARALAQRYWPGPLTLVLRAGDTFEGFRVPDHPVTLAVLRAAGGVLRVTSANRSGEPAAQDAEAAAAALAGHVRLVLDAGPAPLGRESTVVREEGGELTVLREGAIPAAEILGVSRPLLVFVCTGNVCRSPMAASLLRHWLGRDTEWDVQSAGVMASPGQPITVEAAMVLKEKGIDALQHTSRCTTRGLVDAARLIVVMTEAHREILLERFPGIEEKVFLLKSFGYSRRDEDIPDPIGQPIEVYRKVRDDIDAVMPDLILDMQALLGR
jgi:L-threonylcarbamoyladenylate synthase